MCYPQCPHAGTAFELESRISLHRTRVLFRWVLLAAVSLGMWLGGVSDPAPARGANPVESLDDPPLPFSAQRPPSEAETDRIRSAAWYAQGRVHFARQQNLAALRRFQRAWRYDQAANSLLPEIVFLAYQLQRREEAARYAVLAAERTDLDPSLLRQLALQLSRQREWARAVRLYEKAWNRQQPLDGKQPDAATVLLEVELGRIYFLTENFAKSAEFFARVREALKQPELFAGLPAVREAVLGEAEGTYLMLAEGFFQAGRYGEAAEMFRQAHAAKANPELLGYQLARVAAKQGRPAEALESLYTYFRGQATSEGQEPYELLTELHRAQLAGQPEAAHYAALAALEHLAKTDSRNAPLLGFLGQTQLDAGRLPDAERFFKQLLTVQPGLDAYTGLARVYSKSERSDELLLTLGAAVTQAGSLQPLDDLRPTLTSDKANLHRWLDAARRQLDGPSDALGKGVLLVAAWLAFQDRQYAQAESAFARAVPLLDPAQRDRMLLSWGVELMLAERYPAAAQVFRQALENKSAEERTASEYLYLVRALAGAGQIRDALQTAELAAKAQPASPRLVALPGWVLYRDKRYQEAEARYSAVLQAFDNEKPTAAVREELRDARLILSNICLQLDRRGDAEEWLEQVLDEFPEDIGAANDLAYLWTERGEHLQRALTMIEHAVAAEPNNPAYIDSLGWVHYQLGRYAEAVKHLEKAAAGKDTDGTILEHLGDAYFKLASRDKALQTWRQAAAAFAREGETTKRDAILNKLKNHEK